jgi:Ca2+-binding RTX toxin-like protein
LTEGDGWINSLTGNDAVYGTSRSENLVNSSGNAILVAGGGNDRIYAGDDDDIIDGGTGNDVLYGERGNDTYIFRRGSGNDLIIDPDPTAGNTDKIWLGSNLAPDEIRLQRSGNNLVLSIIDTSDTLTVRDYFRNNSTLNWIEEIHFMDGTVWDENDIYTSIVSPTDGDDTIYDLTETNNISGLGGNDKLYGLAGDDVISGDEGNDTIRGANGDDTLLGGPGSDKIYGESGRDTIDGGPGNDTLYGGVGPHWWWNSRSESPNGGDSYHFGRGSGNDTIIDYDRTEGNIDVLQLGPNLTESDVKIEIVNGRDLRLTITDTGDTATAKDWALNEGPHFGIDVIRFHDGSEWDSQTIEDMTWGATSGADYIKGYESADIIDGLGGDDTIYAFRDDDILQGNGGADRLFGSSGNDRIFGGGDNDILDGGTGRDSLRSLRSNDYALAA